MATISDIKQQRHLSSAEMDEVIERAAKLQVQSGQGPSGFTVEQLKQLGEEVDIDPRFVDSALEQMRVEKQAASAAAARARALRKKLLLAGAAALALLLLVAWLGSSGVREAQGRAEVAGSALAAVIDRQSALLPQLLAMGGGTASELEAHRKRLAEASTPDERAQAADRLQVAMAGALAKLPSPADPAQAQMRLSLHHELVGAQNRITVERRRYDEAMASWRAAGRNPAARLAVGMGFAERAPE
jgi:LemA protein